MPPRKATPKAGAVKKAPAAKGSKNIIVKNKELKASAVSRRSVKAIELPPSEKSLAALSSKVRPNPDPIKLNELKGRIQAFGLRPKTDLGKILETVNRINPKALLPVEKLPEDIRQTIQSLQQGTRRFHGAKFNLGYFPFPAVKSPCADMFGYLSSAATRTATKLPFDVATQALLGQLGALMGDPGRETSGDAAIPAGFTYVGQFVDHDITLDVSSTLDAPVDATKINNLRTPVLDLDSVYGRGPALEPYRYEFPSTGPSTAIRMQLGSNTPVGAGGPGGPAGAAGMVAKADFDVPRVKGSNTAIIGDPRNDENLIVVQFHHAMLRFHNEVVDMLVLAEFSGDIFIEAKKIVTQHYQWAVVNDFLRRVCGNAAVDHALANVSAPIGSAFRMPVEFAVAAYRFGHSMIRDQYWVNFNFPFASLGQVFQFSRNPNLPVMSNWVVDFNAFFETGIATPIFNRARKIDSVMATGLESLPGGSGIMAVLATRNLRRGQALGLPSGQGMAAQFGITPMTAAQLTSGLPPNEVAVLQGNGNLLLNKTPLWYYVLREAAVLGSGERLGPVGAKIVADTFVRMLKRDANSYLNVSGGFTPFLPAAAAGSFTFADLIKFTGVHLP